MSKRKPDSPLVTAAEAVQRELESFEQLAQQAVGSKLDSQKRLGSAGRMLTDLCDVEERLQGAVGELVRAVAVARDRQQTLARDVHTWALEVQERAATFQELRGRLASLGEAIAPISDLVTGDAVDLDVVAARIHEVAELATALEVDASAQGFQDVAREGRTRREQLLAALHKLERYAGSSLPEA